MPDVLLVVKFVSTDPCGLILKFTLTNATHSGGAVVVQVTLTPGVEPFSLSALQVTVWCRKILEAA